MIMREEEEEWRIEDETREGGSSSGGLSFIPAGERRRR